ncbi:MAG: ATP-binding protein [Fidelibacterota bacterium]
MTKKLVYQIFPAYLLVTIVAIFALTLISVRATNNFYFNEKKKELKSRAILVSEIITESQLKQSDELASLCNRLGDLTNTRITIIAKDGAVLGDSDENPSIMENHLTRPEVEAAIKTGIGTTERYSHTLGQEMLYLAIPVKIGSTEIFIRSSFPVTALETTISRIRNRVIFWGTIIIVLVAIASLGVSHKITHPLKKMQEGAERFAAGEFSNRLEVHETDEIGGLANSLNVMASQLDTRIKTIVDQKNEREAVLASMIEGVLAVDSNERIIILNKTAIKLFKINQTDPLGKPIHEVIRSTELVQFIQQVLSSNTLIEKEIVFFDITEKYLKIHGTPLKSTEMNRIGALIVFDDITHLKRLENVRREFVANVSHELKTPITSIRGASETLMNLTDSAVLDTQTFVDIITRQSIRLETIINDLLELSRIERFEENHNISMENQPLKPVILQAIGDCQTSAENKNIRLCLDVDDGISATINAGLIQQALNNLIENAISYSHYGSEVNMVLNRSNDQVHLSVEDRGCGIEGSHIPRIFERFYRVDHSRSRNAGGTGLGLSIVKHIVQVHNGSVSVKSEIGKGSTFTITLGQQTCKPGVQ